MKEALSQLLERVNDGKPVVASPSVFSTWYVSQMELVKRKASMGAILVNPWGRAVCALGSELPTELQKTFYLTRAPYLRSRIDASSDFSLLVEETNRTMSDSLLPR